MNRQTFSYWLGTHVGEGPGKVSRRELARRLAETHPEDGRQQRLIDAQRRNIRRILAGQKATQTTRDAICDALGVPRDAAPSAEDEEEEDDAVAALARDPEIRDMLLSLTERVAQVTAAKQQLASVDVPAVMS